MRNYDPSECSEHLSWKELLVIWSLAIGIILMLAGGAFPAGPHTHAPAPFTCEQVQTFVHGKTQEQLNAVLAGMSAPERAAAAQCLQKPPTAKSAKPHAVHPVQPVQPAVVPIALPAPVVAPPVAPFVCTHQQAEAGECSPQTVAVSPAPKPKPKKGSLMKLLEIILVAGAGIGVYLMFKYGIVKVVQKVLSWWAARKLVPTTQMLLDAHAAFEARLTELEDRFKPAAAPEPAPATVVINEAAHGDEPAKGVTPA